MRGWGMCVECDGGRGVGTCVMVEGGRYGNCHLVCSVLGVGLCVCNHQARKTNRSQVGQTTNAKFTNLSKDSVTKS